MLGSQEPKNIQNFKIVRIVRKKKNEKRKGNEKPKENNKTRKKTMQKNPPCHVNGSAQCRAPAGRAEFRPANERSIGFLVE
jgi:hypothetical protein